MKETIGKLIEKEVRKKQMSITAFADRICCKRNNVYDIFKRSTIDIVQLKRISQVLEHNFFKDLADDVELICDSEDIDDLQGRAVSLFFEVMPSILAKLGRSCSIVFTEKNEDFKDYGVPDLGLPEYFITFTIGENLSDRMKISSLLYIEKKINDEGYEIEVCYNRLYNSRDINIKLDYKTEEQWYKIMEFAFEIYDNKKIISYG